MRAVVTLPRRTQAIAICARDCSRAAAISFSPFKRRIVSSVSHSLSRDLPCAARLSEGTPFKYFPVSIPCAKGVNAIEPTRCSSSVFRSPSRSTQRVIKI